MDRYCHAYYTPVAVHVVGEEWRLPTLLTPHRPDESCRRRKCVRGHSWSDHVPSVGLLFRTLLRTGIIPRERRSVVLSSADGVL